MNIWELIFNRIKTLFQLAGEKDDSLAKLRDFGDLEYATALIDINKSQNPNWEKIKNGVKWELVEELNAAMLAEDRQDDVTALRHLRKANFYLVLSMKYELPDIGYKEIYDRVYKRSVSDTPVRPDGEEVVEHEVG